MAIPKAFQGLDWKNWHLAERPGMTARMKRSFEDAEDGTHIITIAPSGFFEIYNIDGEIAWSGMFPSVERAHRAALAIIEGMGK